jgi:hypothetical protein
MNKNCWYALNIDITNAINPSWVKPPTPNGGPNGIWSPPIADIINPAWVKVMHDKGIPIDTHCMLFYRSPWFNTQWAHIDIDGKNKIDPASVGFNIVIDGEDSDMLWYEKPSTSGVAQKTMASTPYSAWEMKSLKEIDRACITSKLTVVRVDMPHGIIMKDRPRWCISLRLIETACTWDPYSWDSATNYLRSIDALIER